MIENFWRFIWQSNTSGTSSKVLSRHHSPNRHSPRQCRHLDFISQFTTDLQYIRGVDNSVDDALSRIEANALAQETTPVIDFSVMAKAQQTDPDLQHLLANPLTSSLQLHLSFSTLAILCYSVTPQLEFHDQLSQSSCVHITSLSLSPRCLGY